MARAAGPPPNSPNSRSRKSNAKAAAAQLKVLEFKPSEQPELPTVMVERDGDLVEFTWPAATVAWWAMWRDSALAVEFTANDWSELLDTALLHARFWRGNMSLAAELRLRVAAFGATPADRARLRITFAQATVAEGTADAAAAKATGARERYGKPAAVADPEQDDEGDARRAG